MCLWWHSEDNEISLPLKEADRLTFEWSSIERQGNPKGQPRAYVKHSCLPQMLLGSSAFCTSKSTCSRTKQYSCEHAFLVQDSGIILGQYLLSPRPRNFLLLFCLIQNEGNVQVWIFLRTPKSRAHLFSFPCTAQENDSSRLFFVGFQDRLSLLFFVRYKKKWIVSIGRPSTSPERKWTVLGLANYVQAESAGLVTGELWCSSICRP